MVYKLMDFGDSTGITQLNKENVVNKNKEFLSKYKEGTPEYDAAATLLYVKALDDYHKGWAKLGDKNKERPYVRTDEQSNKNLIRSLQGKNQTGYINSDYYDAATGAFAALNSNDKFVYEKGTIELPYKNWWDSNDEYKTAVNKVLKEKDKDLRFDFDAKGNRVIYKKTKGNIDAVKNNLEDFIFYAWQSPNAVVYGDAGGDSQYYKKAKNIYDDLFKDKTQVAENKTENKPKKKMGGSTGWLDSYQ
jgi:hypothetical protein